MAVFNSAVFNSNVFFTDAGATVVLPRPSDDEGKKRHRIVKPTGLPPYRARKDISDRISETRELHKEVVEKAREEFMGDPPISEMSMAEIDAEIGLRLREQLKRIENEEDEEFLLMMAMIV